MCTSMSPPTQLCDDCKAVYLRGHTWGDLTFEQVEACDDGRQLEEWSRRCSPEVKFDVPQLCPAHGAREKIYAASLVECGKYDNFFHPDEYDCECLKETA